MLKNRKAQVTIFIIVGLFILLAIVISLYISSTSSHKTLEGSASTEQQLNLESNTIKENIDRCVQTLTDKGVQLMSYQGFYLNIPDGGYKYNDSAYWLKDTVNIMPNDFKKIEDDLAYYIQNSLPGCVNFDDFINNGWQISTFNPFVSAKIFEEDISVEANYTITVKKGEFVRDFSDSIYTPKIRLKYMYAKAADFMNNQLLKPDFDLNNPLDGYDKGGYAINHEKLDKKTLGFSIVDGQSKYLDGSQFTLRFVTSFDTNSLPRTYKKGSQFLFSPDRLAVLYFPSGSPAPITIRQYEASSVKRLQTPVGKKNSEFIGYKDVDFKTKYPIYRFGPSGLSFASPAVLVIFLNSDQKGASADNGLLYNGLDGWIPYPNSKGEDSVTTFIYGFK